MLKQTPRGVMDMLCAQNPEWEHYVPIRVAELIKAKRLFGYESEC